MELLQAGKDTIGIIKSEVDIHTLGISSFEELLDECNFRFVKASSKEINAFVNSNKINSASLIRKWIINNQITVLGLSYRLDQTDGVEWFNKIYYQLSNQKLLNSQGGSIKKICFAGLPKSCEVIQAKYPKVIVFYGDESNFETLMKVGVPPESIPKNISYIHSYDKILNEFGKEIIQKDNYKKYFSYDKSVIPFYGTKKDNVITRIEYNRENKLPPIIRAHAGPYSKNKKEALRTFNFWIEELKKLHLLDVLSIGSSQLSQERFGEDWHDLPNGGGVPVNSEIDLIEIYKVARPLLVRIYSGTRNLPKLASIYEKTINIAWHALSLWWFSEIDGRGPNTVMQNLAESLETLNYIAKTNKPYEPNVAHHFGFRGSDDFSYIVSNYLAAKLAKKTGIRSFILQLMLNTPKRTWGINDLAKSRITLQLLKTLENKDFKIYIQTRTGLDYLHHDLEIAKQQLASATALMDDIDFHNRNSPDIIHVVSYSEAMFLATPEIINESIQITLDTLKTYRRYKEKGEIPDINNNTDLIERMNYLIEGSQLIINTIESKIKNVYSADGLFRVFCDGYLPTPQLHYMRNKYPNAIKWNTKLIDGRVEIISENKILHPKERMKMILET